MTLRQVQGTTARLPARLILPHEGLSHRSYFRTARTPPSLLSALLFSPLCNEPSALPEEAVTEVFIKRTSMHKAPRTGKSHSGMKGNRRGVCVCGGAGGGVICSRATLDCVVDGLPSRWTHKTPTPNPPPPSLFRAGGVSFSFVEV